MLKAELETVVHVVKKGEKGRLITQHANKRQVFARNCLEEFENALGGPQQGEDMIQRFKVLNRGNAFDKAMADGLVSSLIHQFQLGRVVLLDVLGIGTWRYKRIKEGLSKKVLMVFRYPCMVSSCFRMGENKDHSVPFFADNRLHGH